MVPKYLSPGGHPNFQAHGKKFVLSRMEETWVVWLKNETTLFKHVTLRDILDHLGATSTGGKVIDVRTPSGNVILVDWRPANLIIYHLLQGSAMEGQANRHLYIGRVVCCRRIPLPPCIKTSLTNDLSSKGYHDSTRLGKSGSPTSKTPRRRSSASFDTPTSPRIPLARPTPPRTYMGYRKTKTPCGQRHPEAAPRLHHQALSPRTSSSITSVDSWTTWRPLLPRTRMF